MTVHPLQEVRDERATKKHNRDLGGLIKQAIVDQIKTTGECHADDLIELYPEGEVDLCRRLATAQFGSMASRKLIRKDGWRPTKNAARKGGGGWIWKFTQKGREQLVGNRIDASLGGDGPNRALARVDAVSGESSGVGVRNPQGPGALLASSRAGTDSSPADPSAAPAAGGSAPASEPLTLFPDPVDRPMAA
jgi:hypothetical protein